MDDGYEHDHQLRALAMRVAALEDNVAFLEQWCEEQQDTLDRAAGPLGYDYELEPAAQPTPRTFLRVVDLRDGTAPADVSGDSGQIDDVRIDVGGIVAVVETEYDRKLRQIRAQLNRLRTRLALSVAPPAQSQSDPLQPPGMGRAPDQISARPAGRTAP
jgi:hypothetical protein